MSNEVDKEMLRKALVLALLTDNMRLEKKLLKFAVDRASKLSEEEYEQVKDEAEREYHLVMNQENNQRGTVH